MSAPSTLAKSFISPIPNEYMMYSICWSTPKSVYLHKLQRDMIDTQKYDPNHYYDEDFE